MSKSVSANLSLLGVVASVVGCDRFTKQVAVETLAGEPTQSYFHDMLRLSYAENPGSFLSLGAQLPESVRFGLFTVGTGILLVVLALFAIRARSSTVTRLALALFVAGGASNWVDRVSDGRVIDFLNVGIGSMRTGIFNVADMAISAGIFILLFSEYSRDKTTRHNAARD